MLGLALLVAVAARLLPRAGWAYRAPGLGLAAWYAVLATLLSSAAGAVLSLFVHLPSTRAMVCAWWAWCVNALTGVMGPAARLLAWAVVAVLAVVGVRAGMAAVRTVGAGLRRHREQVALLGLIGRRDEGLGAVVVDDPRPAAYALPGRSGAVVVTSGAVEGLPPTQLAAVLAHERAHTTGRHHLLVQAVRLLAAAFPAVAVFTLARIQVDRLVEMRADDVATRRHAGIDLARALVACAEAAAAGEARVAAPVGTVAVTGGDALERVQRLLSPPPPLGRTARAGIVTALAALVTAPLLVFTLVEVFPALAACLLVT